MRPQITLLTLAMLAVLLCPQGLVVCVCEEGRIGLEPAGSPCCPEESSDCAGCVDRIPETPGGSVAAATVSAPEPVRLRADPPEPEDPGSPDVGLAAALSPARDAHLDVVLLI